MPKKNPAQRVRRALVKKHAIHVPPVLPNAEQYAAYLPKEDAVAEDSLEALRGLAIELMDKERAVADAQEALDKATGELAQIKEHRLPEMLDRVEMPEFKFVDSESGATLTISVENEYHVSQPKDKEQRKKGFAWLIKIGKKGIIKETVEVPVGRNASVLAKKIAAAVKKIDKTLDVGFQRKVESSTLRAAVIDWMRAGKNVPEGLFNIHEKRVANVTTA